MISRQELTRTLEQGGLSIADRSGCGKPIFIILACTCDECIRKYVKDDMVNNRHPL